MKIRIIGEKSEIETFCKNLEKAFLDMTKSKLYTSREGSYHCYISINDSAKGGGRK
ncbi:MAG: hypothetical protein J6B74_03415 [Ruminococcus sp.]|nr:hypothetical protein [Ruminococcus sp.]